jgi:hypothetical protein
MPIVNNNDNPTVVVTEVINDVVVGTPGPQGPRGKTILNGEGAPSNNLGVEGDFYYDKTTTKFYGPKLNDLTWDGATSYFLSTGTLTFPFATNQVLSYPTGATGNDIEYWYLTINHNLGYNPNVTIKNSAGDVLETGINYNSFNQITLIMAQPFGGTAYLS